MMRSIVILFALISCVPRCVVAQSTRQRLRVVLKNSAVMPKGPVLTVGDVAEVSGGPQTLRRKVAALDLAVVRGEPIRISKRETELRLILDGVRRDEFEITGPDRITIAPLNHEFTRDSVEQALETEVARQFGLSAEDVQVHLTNEKQIESIGQQLGSGGYTVLATLGTRLPIGAVKIQAAIESGSGRRISVALDTQVNVTRKLTLASVPIRRGTVIRDEMIRVVERPVSSHENYASPEQVIGRSARSDIASNEILVTSHLTEPRSRHQPLVSRNAMLDVVVLLKGNEIRLKNAKALSSGNQGDTITVVNTLSNRQFHATVVAANLAMVDPYPTLKRRR